VGWVCFSGSDVTVRQYADQWLVSRPWMPAAMASDVKLMMSCDGAQFLKTTG
jgi:hypothetical protein